MTKDSRKNGRMVKRGFTEMRNRNKEENKRMKVEKKNLGLLFLSFKSTKKKSTLKSNDHKFNI